MQGVMHFFNGLAAGATQVMIMQPFQRIKVLLQTQTLENKKYNGIVDCFFKILKTEGILGFYKGTLVPLMGIGFIGSLRFGLFENFKLFFKSENYFTGETPTHYSWLSGYLTGTITSLFLCPIQHTRIRMQIQSMGVEKIYTGSLNAAIVIAKKHGIQGLNKGQHATMIRESTGMGFYFMCIDYFTKALTPAGVSKKDTPIYIPLIVGGIAGISYWCFNYPVDYAKTLMQSDSFVNQKYRGLYDCFVQQSKKGYKTFFKGYTICMMRAFSVNAGALVTYRTMQTLLGMH